MECLSIYSIIIYCCHERVKTLNTSIMHKFCSFDLFFLLDWCIRVWQMFFCLIFYILISYVWLLSLRRRLIFFNERCNESCSGGEEWWEGTWRRTNIEDIFYEKKIYFLKKKNINKREMHFWTREMNKQSREPGFSSQKPPGGIQPSRNLLPREIPSSDLSEQGAFMWYTYIHTGQC